MAALAEHSDETSKVKTRDAGLDAELKRRLIDQLDILKRPNDLVRVTQVTKNHFRVNTLTPSHAADAVMTTYRISKSQFLHVEDKLGELLITDHTRH
jgi:uncharacterized protein YpuA (DUF1002 family)